jgi:hypothetical protein
MNAFIADHGVWVAMGCFYVCGLLTAVVVVAVVRAIKTRREIRKWRELREQICERDERAFGA